MIGRVSLQVCGAMVQYFSMLRNHYEQFHSGQVSIDDQVKRNSFTRLLRLELSVVVVPVILEDPPPPSPRTSHVGRGKLLRSFDRAAVVLKRRILVVTTGNLAGENTKKANTGPHPKKLLHFVSSSFQLGKKVTWQCPEPECQKILPSRRALTKHKQEHAAFRREYHCRCCALSFPSMKQLRLHYQETPCGSNTGNKVSRMIAAVPE